MTTAVRLEINNLKKTRNNWIVMDEISLKCHAGEIFVLAGSKGSGKSLLSKLVVSLIKKTDGDIKINGKDSSKKFYDAIKNIGAALPEQTFYESMSGFKTVAHIADLNLRPVSRARIANVMKLLGMRSIMHLPVERYNKSQLQLLKIASAIVSSPELLILDEPFCNLMPEQAHTVRIVLKTLADKHDTAIFITTASLDEVQEICDTIAIIDDGMLIQIKSYNEMLSNDSQATKIGITTETPNFAAKLIDEHLSLHTALCGSCVVVSTHPQNAKRVVDLLHANNVKILSVQRVNRPLSELFFEAIQRKRAHY